MQSPNSKLAAQMAASAVNRLAPYEMTCAQYLAEVVTICVYPQMVRGEIHLTCADQESEDNLARLATAFESMAPASEPDPLAWAKRSLDKLLDKPFPDDCWYSHAVGYPPILLIKQSAIENVMSLETAIRRSHMCQVGDALADGVELPPTVRDEYRAQVDGMGARELH